jgi:alkylation response protein AidB-like acyl-CoA dehydrogenase
MAAAMANARAADAAWEVPASALQVLGGIGFSWEHDLQFWLKRGRVAGRMLGTAREHRERVADLVGLGAGEPAAVA